MSNSTKYKNQFNKERYDRINLSVPKGMKEAIQNLALEKGLSVNAYILELVRSEQEKIFDSMQLSEANKKKVLSIKGNPTDGYEVRLKDGRIFNYKAKKDIRNNLAQDSCTR